MNKTFLYTVFIAMMWLAISSCRTERSYPDKVFLTKVKLNVDNDSLYYWDFDDLIRQQPNRRLLYTVRFHTGMHNLGYIMKDRTEKRTKKWEKKVDRKKRKDPSYREDMEKRNRKINGGLRNWLMYTVGEAPVYLDTTKTSISSEQMLKYCFANGYFDAKVSDTTIYKGKNKTKAQVEYTIESGVSYRINKIDYVSSDAGLLRIVLDERKDSYLYEGMVYNEEILDDERTRINDVLKKTGYYHFSKAFIRYEADTTIGNHMMNMKLIINRPSYSVKNGKNDSLIFYNHKRYMVRNIYVYTDFEINNKTFSDFDTTIYVKQRRDNINDTIFFVHRYPLKIKPKTISRKIFIKRGKFFNVDNARKTQNELSNLNNFKYINVRFQTDSIKDFSTILEYMDAHIELSRLPVNSTSFEVEGTNSSGNLGTAGNWVFKNRNLFNGAEIFDFNISGGLELQKSVFNDDDDNELNVWGFNSFELASEIKLTVPAFLLPINQNRFSQNSRPMTRFSAGFSYQQRPDYERYISHFKLAWQWRESTYRNIEVYLPMNLVRINPDSAFSERIQEFSRTIRYSYEDHFIPGIGMLMQFNNQSNTNKKNYSFRTTRIELAGLSLWVGNGFNNANDSLNGRIYKVLGINYAQYAKFDFDWRYYFRLNDQNIFAFRTFLGLGLPFGNSVILPFEKSYSAGGSNEIRAWKYRSLGPGVYDDTLLYDKTGDIALVMNLEYRFPIVSWFKGAFFLDGGNVWLLNDNEEFSGGQFNFDTFYKQLALGTGFGLRLDFDFFILRLDASFALHDPAKPEGHRWVGFYSLANHTNLNFGIGYPF